jgi:hypothetical protein
VGGGEDGEEGEGCAEGVVYEDQPTWYVLVHLVAGEGTQS